MRLVIVCITVFAAGCVPGLRLERPAQWPSTWEERFLYATPNAYIYASDEAGADEADRLVREEAKRIRADYGRQIEKGLVVVTDTHDPPFTGDLKSLLTIVANGMAGRHEDDKATEMSIAITRANLQGVASSFGVDMEFVYRVAALPLAREEIGRLIGLPADQTAGLGWAVAMPTRGALRAAIREARPQFLKARGIGPAAQIALAPLIPAAEAFAMDKMVAQWKTLTNEQICWTDPELAPIVAAKRREDPFSPKKIKAAILNARSWQVVKSPGAGMGEYREALSAVQSACALAPGTCASCSCENALSRRSCRIVCKDCGTHCCGVVFPFADVLDQANSEQPSMI